MTLTLARVNEARQLVKHLLDEAEAQFPNDAALAAIHTQLAAVDASLGTWTVANMGGGVHPLDGTPKPAP